SAGGASAASVGGAGGGGTTNSITGSSVTYGGGGGGGGATAGSAGGAGGAGATNGNGTAGTTNRGGGGGGARSTSASVTGGLGGSGVVIIRYPKFCGVPSAPTSVSFSSPTMSWGAPAFVPSGQSVTSYTVTYKNQADGNGSTGWGIYARGSAATSINVTGKTISDCTTNNSGWTCVLTNSNLVSGQTYVFRVFARTASTLGRSAPIPTATQITYAVP
ncbi:MAG: fibronectin type III domain-containing protein, partial [Actinomycetota bacterium]|nr:fibronectin type III domain-containing protein [Actinomycetota bacterium]